ncbi:NAD(P)-binding protein [Mycobacterium sp. CBMA293]|uniref:FAD binding domain-containing protein n=3 Tax=Mycolicibacterium TaxID=1866885 RepID=UPI0012DE4FF0|nr:MULTISPECIES: FAD-dependent monooxygenase [unclassified Mycolicibacterium]MUL45231.1 NAD(P)-binding protein [Mycolicibacterium sp. CBMA 360]MUL56751.1 NAD(P)-binding protein [Mycolicibacterium sp. CBMA 335]MUL69790.1 NAD(P)-binding protein [Mycolicibacterium sp. CBMA 311]MUL91838.1 NAD(P)-binding protein [Mycolicibacterium sp. CBMA 230]MUM05578.1 monooxygenase [Mycolicibacterium sp. CBMA 213]
MQSYAGSRAIVVGGSIGGLTTALLLRKLGFDIDVFERTPTNLEHRGGGIVLQPIMMKWFDGHSAREIEELSTKSSRLRYLGRDNEVLHDEPAQWRYTSWDTVYRALLSDFGADHYHLGEFFAGFSQDAEQVELRFASGRRESADLVVFSDGISSTARRRLFPDLARQYSGYVGWRGTVREDLVTEETRALLGDALTYSIGPHTQAVMYTIPGMDGELEEGKRLLNYVWYRNVADGPELQELTTDVRGFEAPVSMHPGAVQQRFIDEMKAAAVNDLAPAVAEVIVGTEQPYLQVVFDTRIPAMADGRVAIVGDAAFAARPHAAAGSAKAAADAWALYEHLGSHDGGIAEALKLWEPGQLALGNQLVDRVSAMGARSQFSNTWAPGDPDLRFGLYGPGK